MTKETAIKLSDQKKVRTFWDDDREKWHFFIVDVVGVLTENEYQGARNYWKVLKHRLNKEGNETVTNCNQLKMLAPDGKKRKTDVTVQSSFCDLFNPSPHPKPNLINHKLKH